MSIKKAVAVGMLLEQGKNDSVEFLMDSVGKSFMLLANLDPEAALSVLEQLNDQFNEEIAEGLINSRNEQIEKIAQRVVIPQEELEG